jgi:hypothetical protein
MNQAQDIPLVVAPDQECHFLRLPAEIRNQIYSHVFHLDSNLSRKEESDYTFLTLSQAGWKFNCPGIDLALTCRSIRNETMQMYFASTALHISVWPAANVTACMGSWHRMMDDTCRGWHIPHVRVTLLGFYDTLHAYSSARRIRRVFERQPQKTAVLFKGIHISGCRPSPEFPGCTLECILFGYDTLEEYAKADEEV